MIETPEILSAQSGQLNKGKRVNLNMNTEEQQLGDGDNSRKQQKQLI